MNATTLRAKKWALEVETQNLGAGLIAGVLLRNVARDGFDAAISIVQAGGNGGSEDGSGAVTGDCAGDCSERFV